MISDLTGMGRWSGLTLRGRHSKLTAIITCYRVSDTTINSTGPLTSYRRQVAAIAITSTSTDTPNPRKQCLEDLATAITELIQFNHDIILCIGANVSLQQGKSLASFLQKTGLQAIDLPSIASTRRGQKTIDYIFVTPRVLQHISSKGKWNSIQYMSLIIVHCTST